MQKIFFAVFDLTGEKSKAQVNMVFMILSELEKRIHDSAKGAKKNRVVIEDYELSGDIQNRLLLSDLKQEDVAILEEILYSPLTIPLQKLANSADVSLERVREFIKKFQGSELFALEGENLIVNKEKRKYFEIHIEKFSEEFSPGMEFLQGLLKNVPIHVLPGWYQIPRTSDSIFESIVEKYLYTPRTYYRYLLDFTTGNSLLKDILQDLEAAPGYKLYADDICEKYGVSPSELSASVILGEFNFLFCSSFEPHLDQWVEVITPFAEWRDYLLYLKNGVPKNIENEFAIELKRCNEYAFIEDMTTLLLYCEDHDLSVGFDESKDHFTAKSPLALFETEQVTSFYIDRLINKLLVLGLAVIEDQYLRPTDHSDEWIKMPIEKRVHVTFKHPHNFLDIQKISPLSNDRSILEIQKSMAQVVDLGWIFFDDFIKGCPIELSDEKKVSLKKKGRVWRYVLPEYTPEEFALIRFTIMEWFFESGIVQSGQVDGRDCFKLTALGRSLFT